MTQIHSAQRSAVPPALLCAAAAIRNLAGSERGRQELASDPATVPCLVRALAGAPPALPGSLQEPSPRAQAVQVRNCRRCIVPASPPLLGFSPMS